MILSRAYDYYFYRIYRWSCFVDKSLHGGMMYNSVSAIMMITLALELNMGFLIVMYFDLFNKNFHVTSGFDFFNKDFHVPSEVVIVAAIIFIFIANYMYFVVTKRYKVIIARYNHESRNAVKYGLVGTFFYFLFSVVLLLAAVWEPVI